MKIENATDPSEILGVDPTFAAARTCPIPKDSLGQFRISTPQYLITNEMVADTSIFQMRWSDTSRLALIQMLRLQMIVTTAPTIAQELNLQLHLGREWTTDWVTGTEASLPTESLNYGLNPTQPVSRFAVIRYFRNMSLGFSTVQTTHEPLAVINGWAGAVNTIAVDYSVYFDDYPIVLQGSEGIYLRNRLTLASGALNAIVTVQWAECSRAQFQEAWGWV